MKNVTSPCAVIANSTSSYVYKFRLPIIAALQARGLRVVIVAPRDEFSAELEALGCEFHHIELDGKSTNPVKELLLISRFYAAYRALRPSLVLHYTPKPNIYGSLATRLLGIPTINNISGLGSGFIRGGWLQKVVTSLYKASQRKVDTIFFQNKDDMALFLANNIATEKQSKLLPGSGVDVGQFPQSDLPERSHTTFLFIGRLIRDKGVIEFLQAASSLLQRGLNAQFMLLGGVTPSNPSSLSEKDVDKWSQVEGISFLGEHVDVLPYIERAHCVVLPSYREGTPRSLLEAASVGRPMIAADSVGCREPVDDGVNGYLCKPGDVADLAEKMQAICELGLEPLRTMGQESRRIAEQRYDVKHVVRAYDGAVSLILSAEKR